MTINRGEHAGEGGGQEQFFGPAWRDPMGRSPSSPLGTSNHTNPKGSQRVINIISIHYRNIEQREESEGVNLPQ